MWQPVYEVGLSGLLLDSPHSGTAVYTRNLAAVLPRVAPEFAYRLFVRDADLMPEIPATRLSSPVSRLNAGRAAGGRLDKLLWETVALPLAVVRHGEAMLHSLYFAAPPVAPAPVVVTVHDLILLALRGYYRSRWATYYTRLMSWTVRRGAAIVTVSEHARDDVLRVLRVPEEQVFVTPEAADPRCCPDAQPGEEERIRARYRLPHRFILYLGGAERRKNLEMLVRAWVRIAAEMERDEVRLVIVAAFPPPDRLYPDVPELARSLELGDGVVFVDSVAEEDKPAMYRAALAFCFPSTYEGFGLTPLEAMACGTPVIASNATSLPEVVGDAGMLLPPNDDDAWAEAIRSLVRSSSDRARLRGLGLERAATFSWERTARQTADVYHWVLSR
jgi:glycosyltransferase involved in cell wall biosynthesis